MKKLPHEHGVPEEMTVRGKIIPEPKFLTELTQHKT
jgi:hypothetical protein